MLKAHLEVQFCIPIFLYRQSQNHSGLLRTTLPPYNLQKLSSIHTSTQWNFRRMASNTSKNQNPATPVASGGKAASTSTANKLQRDFRLVAATWSKPAGLMASPDYPTHPLLPLSLVQKMWRRVLSSTRLWSQISRRSLRLPSKAQCWRDKHKQCTWKTSMSKLLLRCSTDFTQAPLLTGRRCGPHLTFRQAAAREIGSSSPPVLQN